MNSRRGCTLGGTACALVRIIQSNCCISARAASSVAKSSGSAKDTSGSTTAIAPRAVSSRASASLCPAARVITIRFPTKPVVDVSPTLPAHFFQNRLRARLNQHSRHVFSKLRRLIRRSGSALLHVLHPVHRTYTRLPQELAALDSRPRAHPNLPPALHCALQSTFRNHRPSRRRII